METRTLHPVVEFIFAADPIAASEAGDTRYADRLGDVGPDAIAEHCATRRRFLDEAEQAPTPERGTREWLEHQVLLAELRAGVAADEHVQAWRRAPYWYPERIGTALSTVMPAGGGETEGRALLGRLREIPAYLATAAANLTEDAPQLWAQMGQSAAQGLSRFLEVAVPAHAASLPERLGTDITAAAAAAGPAVDGFAACSGALAERATGRWRSGTEYFDLMLRDYHHAGLDARQLTEWGRERVAADQAELVAFAASLDSGRDWREQIDTVKDDHPQSDDFLTAYGASMAEVRRHTADADLLGLPDGEICVMDWVPEYRREGLPLGVMETCAPFAPGLRSEFLITPTDPQASPELRREHARDNSYVFISSITGHETYPGHHIQAVHHKLGTARDSMLRYVRCPQFVEGWGLYTEDLMEETGFMADDRVRLFKRRNSLWRSLRVLIDAGLHTSALSIDEAVALLVDKAGMDHHMAAGEVRRYTRHDNPTYTSSYALGRDAFHRVRAQAQARPGFTLRTFHDDLLAHGSPPLALIAAVLDRAATIGR